MRSFFILGTLWFAGFEKSMLVLVVGGLGFSPLLQLAGAEYQVEQELEREDHERDDEDQSPGFHGLLSRNIIIY